MTSLPAIAPAPAQHSPILTVGRRTASIEAHGDDDSLLDLRFRALVPGNDWAALSPAVRRRFGKRLGLGMSATYVGTVTLVDYNRAGWLLAQAVRLIGGPLPLVHDAGRASVVTVTEDAREGGQVWTRLYARANGFPQVIHSAKRFTGPTGLEEHVGAGVAMSLVLSVEEGALTFRSDRYFLCWFGCRWRFPAWLSPGRLVVTHAEVGSSGDFRFTLDVIHPWFGHLVHQEACFCDAEPVVANPEHDKECIDQTCSDEQCIDTRRPGQPGVPT